MRWLPWILVLALASSFPEELKGLHFGMSVKELQAARPKASPFVLLGEPEPQRPGAPDLYVEEDPKAPFFDHLDYTFFAHRLCIVKLTAMAPPDFETRRARILKGALAKWGEAASRVLETPAPLAREGKAPLVFPPVPGLRWTSEDTEILLTYTPTATEASGGSERNPRPSYVALVLLNRSCLPAAVKQDWDKAIAPADDAAHARLFAALKQAASPPLFK